MTVLTSAARTEALVEEAAGLFPGGVNSPVRAFGAVGRRPIVLDSGLGAYVTDADGKRYVDYVGGWGSAILGHAHPQVIASLKRALASGLALGATHPSEVMLAAEIRRRMPSLELLRFTSSGTEAAMSAVRLARAATGRDVIVKFAGAYHGHSDAVLVEAGSGVATLGIPGSAGVTEATARDTVVVPFNDPEALAVTFARHAGRIAAVLVEPVLANVGVIPADRGFLRGLRESTHAHGSLLIFDEVITGFRLAPGGAQELYEVAPDLTLLGKIIGGGMPVGAYGGRRDLMDLVAPIGPVYQAGTLSGHPLTMAAGLATLLELTAERYRSLDGMAARLEAGLDAAARGAGVQDLISISRVGSLLTLYFTAARPADAAAALESDRRAYARFFGAMLEAGVLLPPSQFEAWFVSLAHGSGEIDRTIGAAATAFSAAAIVSAAAQGNGA